MAKMRSGRPHLDEIYHLFFYLIKITCYFEAQTEPALLSAQFIINWIGQVDFNQFLLLLLYKLMFLFVG